MRKPARTPRSIDGLNRWVGWGSKSDGSRNATDRTASCAWAAVAPARRASAASTLTILSSLGWRDPIRGWDDFTAPILDSRFWILDSGRTRPRALCMASQADG